MNLTSLQFMSLSRFERMGLIQFSYAKTWSPGRYGSWSLATVRILLLRCHHQPLIFLKLAETQLVSIGTLW